MDYRRLTLWLAGLAASIGIGLWVVDATRPPAHPMETSGGELEASAAAALRDREALRGRPADNSGSGLSGHRLERLPERQNPELGEWAPILLLHLRQGVFQGYPARFAEAGHGEFTLYYWRRFNLLGFYWLDNAGTPRAVVVALDVAAAPGPQLRGVLTADPGGCEWLPGSRVRLIRDRFGLHPLLSVMGARPEAGLGDLQGSFPESGLLDWTEVPEQGLGYRRNWSHQDHLPGGVPTTDGVVVRFEASGGYAQSHRPGRGNTPHHWNLLAYRLLPIEDIQEKMAGTAADPNHWVCTGLVERTAAAVDAAVARQGRRVIHHATPEGGKQ